jgi:hypothetical protein
MKKISIVFLLVFVTAGVFSQNGLTVISPNGGENWVIGCPSPIQWVTTNTTSGPVKIELFKNGQFYMTISSQVPAGVTTFTWVPPYNLLPGNTFKVKVTGLTSAAVFDFSDNDFSITRGSITVISPNGGETWVKGTMHPVLWNDNLCGNVRIELWKGGLFHSVIAASVPSSGSFAWMIPNVATLVPGSDYKVRVLSVENNTGTTVLVQDFSDNDFTIAPAPAIGMITVVAPNGGESWIIGCPATIQWISTAAVYPVKIELYRNNNYYMTICSQAPAGQSSFTWIPPYSIAPGNNYKVRVSSLSNAAIFDFSDNNFSITRGSITVVSPNGGETWVKGTMHPILWTDNICQNVRIELWKGNLYHSLIAGSVPSTGMFGWIIPNINTLVPGNDYRVKVISVSNLTGTTALVFDFSDNFFTIAPGSSISLLAPGGTSSVYPNPFSDKLNIRLNGTSDQRYSMELMNLRGEVVLREVAGTVSGSGTVELYTAGVASGSYILVVREDNLLVSRQVVVLER